MQLRRIEEASLNAWPALQQLVYDGWIIRFADGYTKRANSITTLYSSTEKIEAKIAFCEQVYQARQLPVVFRLPSFAAPPELDALLAERGYRLIDETLVLTRTLDGSIGSSDAEIAVETLPLDEWLPLYSRLSGATARQEHTHRALLEAICSRRVQFVVQQGDEPIACGLGVMEDGYFGLFDIVTAPIWRGRGYGTRLVAGMLAWARQQGGKYAYLQVVGANTLARHLYAGAGFGEAYRYWYRAL